MENLLVELWQIMEEKNISMSDTARMIGVSRTSLYNWKNGERKPLESHRRLIQNAIRRMKKQNGGNKEG